MDKIENHKFKHKAGFTNIHHLKALTDGGQTISSNLIRLDAYRHCAIHYLFSNKSLSSIINLIENDLPYKKLEYSSNAWKLLFGNKNKFEVIALLKRVKRIKSKHNDSSTSIFQHTLLRQTQKI